MKMGVLLISSCLYTATVQFGLEEIKNSAEPCNWIVNDFWTHVYKTSRAEVV